MRWLRRIAWLAALGLGTVIAVVGAGRVLPVIAFAENWIADLRVAWLRPAAALRNDIVVLGIDEAALATMSYRSPIDSGQIAAWIAALDAAGARAIGIDILFDQPTEPEKDLELKAVLAQARAPVVLGWAAAADGLTTRQLAFQGSFLEGLRSGCASTRPALHDGLRGRRTPYHRRARRVASPWPLPRRPGCRWPTQTSRSISCHRRRPASRRSGSFPRSPQRSSPPPGSPIASF